MCSTTQYNTTQNNIHRRSENLQSQINQYPHRTTNKSISLVEYLMGNCKSCYSCVEPESTATIIDARGNRLQIKVPITAAEIMLDEPGNVVSPAQLIRKTGRIPVMKADEELSAGEVYLVVPASRARCKVSESEMAMIDSACEKRRQKRRSSKVSPAASEGSGEKVEGSDVIKEGNITGLPGHQLASRRTWMPALDPISEGI